MFHNREDAGHQLATLLHRYRNADAVVLALPRGGVPVGYEVAAALELPLDILVVRKLGAPLEPELGMGAVAEGGVRYVDPYIVREVGADDEIVEAIAAREEKEIERRVMLWRAGRPPLPVEGKVAIVVDDGIATGGTARAALRALRLRKPAKIVLAVPVASESTIAHLRDDADEIICVEPLRFMWAIGSSYQDFTQVPDDMVAALLAHAHDMRAARRAMEAPP